VTPIEVRVDKVRVEGPEGERGRAIIVEGKPVTAGERVRTIVVQPQRVEVRGTIERQPPQAGLLVRPAPDDLKQRIDRLLREVEELRRAVQGAQQPAIRGRIIIDSKEKAK
jgi:hypothetical protein